MPVYRQIYEYKGERKHLMAFCKQYKRDFNTVRSRLNRGWSFKDAIEKPNRQRAKIPYRGGYYTYAQLARLSPYNIAEGTMRRRIKDGWSVDDAVNLPRRGNLSAGFRKSRQHPGCVYPDCFNCKLPDCVGG